jgi:hypothetical protein
MAVTTEGLEYMPLDGRLGSAAMEGSSNASGATPQGVREGDRAALQAVVDRRGPAVIAFCTQVCGPHDATRAGAEAFARFRAAVRDAPDLRAVDPELLLRGATRHAAASMARVPLGPPPHGRLRSRGTQTCEHVPTMLAARANGALGEADLERLARHLERCERCNAMAEIFHRAELSYQDPPFDTLGTDTSSVLLEALEAVPMSTIGVAPAPAPDAPSGVTLDGAFGHLPDLEDEVPIEVAVAAPAAEAVDEADAVDASDEADAADLDVEEVGEPAEDLDPKAPAAEPLPEEAPEPVGETAEWDAIVPLPEDHDAAPVVPLLEGGRERRPGGAGRALRVVLPAGVVAAAVAAVLAVAGVFGGDDGTPPQAQPHTPAGIQKPVLTPLPVTVAKPAASATSTTPAGTTLP